MTDAPIDHVVVLVLENRSFDHMLGLLAHPNARFDGVGANAFSNPGTDGQAVEAAPGAKDVLPVGPDHAHDAVMRQLGITTKRAPWNPTNDGFVTDYDRVCRDVPLGSRYAGLVGFILNLSEARARPSRPAVTGRGSLIMRCQAPERVPVLSTLATQFAVCTRWFSSLPGETWPNRNFLHAASSDGEVDIDTRFYDNPTIFELLETRQRSWRIYHDDTPQVWAFPSLWDSEDRHANWFRFSAFADHVGAGDLPSYAFIEPNHRPPLHTLDHDPLIGVPDVSDNQHPENNLVSNDAYDAFSDPNTDFRRAESLVADVYEALRANPDLFSRTLLVVTYDEHGGFADHVPPPATGVPNPHAHPSLGTRLLHLFVHRRAQRFDFTMLGVRVPAVVISPFIERATVDDRVRDHASVPSTLRALFAPDARPLTSRDRWSTPFNDLLTLTRPRTDLPDLSSYRSSPRPPAPAPPPAAGKLPPYYHDFVKLSDKVHDHLQRVGEKEVVRAPAPPADPAQRAASVSDLFAAAAQRHREERAAG